MTLPDNRLLWISIGAVLGANARYLIGLWLAQRLGADFPYGTLLVNVTGSFVLGFLVAWGAARGGLNAELRLLVAVGFLGSYTTFSSFAVESLTYLEQASMGRSLLNFALNNGLGIGAAWLGMVLARQGL